MDKPVITLLEYIREYYMNRIVNVQSVIDKCTGPLTLTTTRIVESIKREAHLMKMQWNGVMNYQVSRSFSDQCFVDVMARTCSYMICELTGIPCKHVFTACWNMALNDQGRPPLEDWVGRQKKKRKSSRHDDERFMKDVDEDRYCKKVTPLGKEIMVLTCKLLQKKAELDKGKSMMHVEDDMDWYTYEMREKAEKVAEGFRKIA
nr:hypothetical protein [Tanacetum cinerariifolium]